MRMYFSGFDAICSVVITNKSKARVEANLENCGMFSLGFFLRANNATANY